MRSFLRADPDIIMVGEMRDAETASLAIEASLTGHLVLSTLHTNSAPETVTRLIDMGTDSFTLSDALLGILAQRLARTLCRCAKPWKPSDSERSALAKAYGPDFEAHFSGIDAAPRKAKGCVDCRGTGYSGRVPIHELLVADEKIKHLILTRAPVPEIRKAAIAGGMTTLIQDGIAKILAGLTDLKQVSAVAGT
jgi:type II secretory ATPase GspE/PulE/Tfp pilus assembly ATPase PilB-like protein